MAVVPEQLKGKPTKKAGVHKGRVSIKANSMFTVRTSTGLVPDINYRFFKIVQRGDGCELPRP